MTARETGFKKKELEQLLREKKIDVDQYLEALARLEDVSTIEVKSEGHGLLKTDFLLIASPFLILIGWFIANLNSVSAYTSDHLQFIPGMTCYPYSPVGLGIMMSSTVLLSVGIACRWVKSVSRGEFIVFEITGWSILMFTFYVLVTGIRIVWVPVAPNSWQSFISIDPAGCSFILILWFIGVFTITYGLAPMRKWFSKSIG
jgi:hypothetical protein